MWRRERDSNPRSRPCGIAVFKFSRFAGVSAAGAGSRHLRKMEATQEEELAEGEGFEPPIPFRV